MKTPHTINSNYFKEYFPSDVSQVIIPDCYRNVKSEDQTWDEFCPVRLTEQCVAVLVKNFKKRVVLQELPLWDRNRMLETLPTDLPLPLVVKHIDDGIYWERKVKDRWKGEANYCQDYDFNWKRMFLEKHMEEAIEAMTPEGYDIEAVLSLCGLTRDYIKRLNIRELQAKQVSRFQAAPEDGDEEAAFAPPLNEHIDLEPIIKNLIHLTELHIQFGLRNVGSAYDSYYFQFTLDDCRNLGKGINQAQNLKLLRVHSCNLDDDKVLALLSNMDRNESLESIDFSNCILKDDGASAVAKYMMNRSNLTKLNLSNNLIGEVGISALAFVLTQPQCCPLEYLNVRCNAFGDGGLKFLASALVRERPVLRNLNVACCNLGEESGIYMGEVLNRNTLLTDLDMSNNHLNEEGGRALQMAIEGSKTILNLDLRATGIPEEALDAIKNVLFFNRIRSLKGERGVQREIRLAAKRIEDERLRLERLAWEEARAAEEAALKAAAEAARAAAEDDD
ncbi:hypothetical protein RUM43_007295 [Polyplax serrata]|uniref:T-complex-associated testis-expressed protein 1 n=1 Tax=Polyplax serrata TaxID=468196 RepID=A0AAN8P5H3_POLSC